MHLPRGRGPLSAAVIDALLLSPGTPLVDLSAAVSDAVVDDDLQLALYCCYELHYRGFDGVAEGWEWNPSLLALRARLEAAYLDALIAAVGPPVPATEVAGALRELVAADDGPSLSAHLAQGGSADQYREFVIHRSAYQLKEADPHTWAIPRLRGLAKATLVGIQYEEYGEGEVDRMHSGLFARTMQGLGLDSSYGHFLDRLPGATLATVNLMSMFGLHRRWRGALVGHLAVFEITSPGPNARYAQGLRRLGFGSEATGFYDEHVEADAVHETMATRDLAQGLADDDPAVAGDILFGARALIETDRRFASHLLDSWGAGHSSLLPPQPAQAAA